MQKAIVLLRKQTILGIRKNSRGFEGMIIFA